MTTDDAVGMLREARAGRRAIPQLSDTFPDLDLPAAYALQAAQRADFGPIVGWKLGVTSRAKQVQVGVDSPIRGFLATDHALDYGEPLVCGDHVNPRCEPEIAFVMGADLAGPHATTTEVLAATASVAPAIEVIDSRYTDYRFTMPDVVADNSSAGRYVLGSPVPLDGIDLRLVGVVMEQNGEVSATASGAASLGHPAAAVAWLVRSLAEHGEGLRTGDVVLSGGLTAATPVSPGDTVVVTIDRLGSVELACR
jgi:2-oxo-3-hexenedioate decarboxylase